jgi:hypothetical protein
VRIVLRVGGAWYRLVGQEAILLGLVVVVHVSDISQEVRLWIYDVQPEAPVIRIE